MFYKNMILLINARVVCRGLRRIEMCLFAIVWRLGLGAMKMLIQ
jgi:hypothetical protein